MKFNAFFSDSKSILLRLQAGQKTLFLVGFIVISAYLVLQIYTYFLKKANAHPNKVVFFELLIERSLQKHLHIVDLEDADIAYLADLTRSEQFNGARAGVEIIA